jgi:UDP-glucose 4-epimerase/UDP-glucuronate decarboxylase
MKILITGGAGFIGFHLAEAHRQRGDQVVILDNLFKTDGRPDRDFEKLVAGAGVTYLAADLTKPLPDQGREDFDVVYHLAAINGTRLFYEMPYQVARTNLLITLNLLDWLESRRIGRLLYASTSEVYAGCEQVGLLTIPTGEEVPVVFPQPTNVRFSYGTSKFMGEFLCLEFGKKAGVPVSVIRYHNIYGPRMGTKHVIPEFILRMHACENPFKIYGGQETRAFCYVDDAVQATILVAAASACDGEIVHIGNQCEEVTIETLAALVMDQFGRRVAIKECGGRSGSVSRRCPDTSKLKRLTGFEARVPLKDGLARTAQWYLSHAGAPK